MFTDPPLGDQNDTEDYVFFIKKIQPNPKSSLPWICVTNTIVYFKRLGSRVSHDSFNQYLLFFSKQCIYCKTNAIYT